MGVLLEKLCRASYPDIELGDDLGRIYWYMAPDGITQIKSRDYNQIIEDARVLLKHDPMIQALPEVVTAENIENEIYPRVADTLVVVSQIWSAMGTGRRLP